MRLTAPIPFRPRHQSCACRRPVTARWAPLPGGPRRADAPA